jgi:hypothetical protein
MEEWIHLLLQISLLARKYVPFCMETKMSVICHCQNSAQPSNCGLITALVSGFTAPHTWGFTGLWLLCSQQSLESEGGFVSADSNSLTEKGQRVIGSPFQKSITFKEAQITIL